MKKIALWCLCGLGFGLGGLQAQPVDDFESYSGSEALLQVYREFDAVNNPLPDRMEIGSEGENHFLSATCIERDYAVFFRHFELPASEQCSAVRLRIRGVKLDDGGLAAIHLRREPGAPDVVSQNIRLTGEWQSVTVGSAALAEWKQGVLLVVCRKAPGTQLTVEIDDVTLVEDPAVAAERLKRQCRLDDYSTYPDAAALRQCYVGIAEEAPAPLLDTIQYDGRAALRLDSGAAGMETVCVRECRNPFGAEAVGFEVDVADVSVAPQSGLLYVSVRATPEGEDLATIKVDRLPRRWETFRALAPELGTLERFFLVFRTARRDREEYREMKYLYDFYGSSSVPFSHTIGAPVTAAVSAPRLLLREQMVNIIPAVRELIPGEGVFRLLPRTAIVVASDNPEALPIAQELRRLLAAPTGFTLPVVTPEQAGAWQRQIVLDLNPARTQDGGEGYELKVTGERVEITAAAAAGLFYGVQSLRQLFDPAIESREYRALEWQIPQLRITDAPEYEWRGMHLDTARHFFPKEYIFRFIEMLAMQKMNVFHWHFNDGTAWRIESEAFPKLTGEGAWWGDVGGFYTRDDVREILAYAQAHFITVVPELEMPVHANAALNAYPENACQRDILARGEHGERNTASWHIRPQWVASYCAGREETYAFIETLLADTIALFPDAPVIHMGGDELPEGAWSECPTCRAFMAAKGMQSEAELQQYFTARVEAIAHRLGQRIMGWEQIMGGKLRGDTMILAYLDTLTVNRAAADGHQVVNCQATTNYLDFYQGDPAHEPVAITSGITPLRKSYSFDPMLGVAPRYRDLVVGGQAALWTEFIPGPAQADYMLYPRLSAIAERLWAPAAGCDWLEFERKLDYFYPRLDLLGVGFKDYRDEPVR